MSSKVKKKVINFYEYIVSAIASTIYCVLVPATGPEFGFLLCLTH